MDARKMKVGGYQSVRGRRISFTRSIFHQSLLSLIRISMHSIYQAVNSMVNPGESVLVESPVYA